MNREQTVSSSSSSGIGFPGALTILFVTLKLTGVIGWSWWWVLSPLIITGMVAAALIFVAILIVFILDR